MRLLKLECEGFRSLTRLCIEPVPGLNIIHGGNAQGKTTVLEALLYAATSKSHRTTLESELVQHGADRFHVGVKAQRQDREVVIDAYWWKNIKRFKVNGVAQTRLSDILGRVHVVFFCPEDIGLIKEGASVRRRFLDMELSQLLPGYLQALQQYRQALRQRNELLRTDHPDPALVDVWDAQLIQYGAVILQLRREFIDDLSARATEAYARVAEEEALTLAYLPDVKTPDELAGVLERSRASDLKHRVTHRGPHRDDMEILVAGRAARSFASQGQQKTAALALKLAELELIRARAGEYPILLLDEVLAELDEHRARRLFSAIGPEVQCLLTTAEAQCRTDRFTEGCAFYRIERGSLEKE